MIKIEKCNVTEASRVWGDMVEKVAFQVNVDPLSIASALFGSYVGSRVEGELSRDEIEKKREEAERKKSLESGYYSQVSHLLNDLKITFTPINVIYSVNGKTFEIIRTDEMTPDMRAAFLRKDAGYFRKLLNNKVNMELQLAEQAFARRLLNNHTSMQKGASYLDQQEALLRLPAEEVEMVKTASEKGLDELTISLPITFDSLRPFNQSADFFRPGFIEKVAGIFSLFHHENEPDETVNLRQLKHDAHVAFLPDRVLYTRNGQLLEQLPILYMNENGYDAFKHKNKDFFKHVFDQKAEEIASRVPEEASKREIEKADLASGLESQAGEEGEGTEKVSTSLEDAVHEWQGSHELHPLEREKIVLFEDPDINPVVYTKVLKDNYGEGWAESEMEALLKQIEVDFRLHDGMHDIPFNKVCALHALHSPWHSLFNSEFAFEKLMRTLNNHPINMATFDDYLPFEELMFGIEIIKAYQGDGVFVDFHDEVLYYLVRSLMQDNMRFVSSQVYDEKDVAEKDFFDRVNAYLSRLWVDRAIESITDKKEMERHKKAEARIVEISERILSRHADQIELPHVYESITHIIDQAGYLHYIDEEFQGYVGNAVIENVGRHVTCMMFLEIKRQEVPAILAKLKENEE